MINTNPLTGFPARTQVNGWAYIQSTSVRTSTNQHEYLAWSAYDVLGNPVNGTLFNDSGKLPAFDHGAVVAVVGAVGESRGNLQVWATSLTPVLDVLDIAEFKSQCLPSVPRDELAHYIVDLEKWATTGIQNPELRNLSIDMWQYLRPFLDNCPAAKKYHEPVRGGLAKHTWQVVSLTFNPVLYRENLDYDVVIFSALYHDLGKVREYTDDMNWAPEGRLVSHISIGLEVMAQFTAVKHQTLDPKTLKHIRHCIEAHHGDFGNVKPLTREALVVHHADRMMSAIGNITEHIRIGSIDNDGWSTQNSQVLGGNPWVPQMDNRV